MVTEQILFLRSVFYRSAAPSDGRIVCMDLLLVPILRQTPDASVLNTYEIVRSFDILLRP